MDGSRHNFKRMQWTMFCYLKSALFLVLFFIFSSSLARGRNGAEGTSRVYKAGADTESVAPFWGEIDVPCSLDLLVEAFADVKSYEKVIPGVVKVDDIQWHSRDLIDFYIEYEIPPYENRYAFLSAETENFLGEKGYYSVKFSSFDKKYDNIENDAQKVKTLRGRIVFTYVNADMTHVYYEIECDLGSGVPPSASNSWSQKNVSKVLSVLKLTDLEKKYLDYSIKNSRIRKQLQLLKARDKENVNYEKH